MSSYEEFRKKKLNNGSYQQFKEKKENPTPVTTNKQQKVSLWENVQNIANTTGKIGNNALFGLKNGLFSSIQTVDRKATNKRVLAANAVDKIYELIFKKNVKSDPFMTFNKLLTPEISQQTMQKETQERYNEIQEKKNENTVKIQQNTESISNPVGKYIAGEIAPSVGQMLPGMLPGVGTGYFITSASGNYYDDALRRGMNKQQANVYGDVMGVIEGTLEKVGADLTKNVGKQLLKKNIKGALVNYGLDIGENFLEESIVEPISELVAGTTAGKDKADWNNMGQRMWESGVAGAITSAITGGASGAIGAVGSQVTQQNKYVDYNTNKKLDKNSQNILKQAENIIQENSTNDLQQELTQNVQKTSDKQVMPMQQENAQNGISEQIVKRNIIDEKVNEYINQNRSNFKTNINIETKVVNDGEPMATNYKNAKEVTIYKKAKELFSKIGLKQFKNNNDTIYVTNQDIKESIRKTIINPSQKSLINENIAVFSSLDKIIQNAKELDVANEHKERSKYDSWKYYISEVNIDNEPHVVEFDTVLREDGQRHFRLERVYNINNIGDSKTTLLAPKANEVVRYGISFYY